MMEYHPHPPLRFHSLLNPPQLKKTLPFALIKTHMWISSKPVETQNLLTHGDDETIHDPQDDSAVRLRSSSTLIIMFGQDSFLFYKRFKLFYFQSISF